MFKLIMILDLFVKQFYSITEILYVMFKDDVDTLFSKLQSNFDE